MIKIWSRFDWDLIEMPYWRPISLALKDHIFFCHLILNLPSFTCHSRSLQRIWRKMVLAVYVSYHMMQKLRNELHNTYVCVYTYLRLLSHGWILWKCKLFLSIISWIYLNQPVWLLYCFSFPHAINFSTI